MRGRESGFTLVEVLIALAIMAVGVTAVIGVFLMATATHKRAVDETTSALFAETALAEVRGGLTASFDARRLPVAAPGPPPVLVWKKGGRDPVYPGYACDVYVTPIDDPDPDAADAFHVEVHVRFLASGKERESVFRTVMVRRVRWRDLGEAGPMRQ
jgi:prepilin-type N-terminal cleavage/methylation domain-containing protein